MNEGLDAVRLNFSPEGLQALNVVLALVMFGIALDLDPSGFRRVRSAPRGVLVGMAAQVVAFPAATCALTLLLRPAPSVALGMLLIAACPAGNMSNFLTHLARGNTALSIALTTLSTASAPLLTPLNVAVWGSVNRQTAPLLHAVRLDATELLTTFGLIIVVPLVAGRVVASRFPRAAARLSRPMRLLSILFFVAFVAVALRANWDAFIRVVGRVAGYVALQDTLALALGYAIGAGLRLPEGDRRAIAIECGIRNSGLGLILVFAFFGGLGGMAVVVAWWGVWHIVSGLLLAGAWSRWAPRPAAGGGGGV